MATSALQTLAKYITRQHGVKEVHITQIMSGAGTWLLSDHRIVRRTLWSFRGLLSTPLSFCLGIPRVSKHNLYQDPWYSPEVL